MAGSARSGVSDGVHSLRARLFVVWALSVAAAVAVGVLLLQLQDRSAEARQARATTLAQDACERIADRYATYTADWSGPPAGTALDAGTRRDLAAVLALALGPESAMQAGFWLPGAAGIVASLPEAALLTDAEREAVAASGAEAVAGDAARENRLDQGHEAVLLQACPLPGPIADLIAWVRVAWGQQAGADPLTLGLSVLFALVVGNAGWIAWIVRGWNRQVGTVEAALARQTAPGTPALPATGEPGLDRIVLALNLAGARLAEAQTRAAAAERLAALGRVAAGVAHEIRNPLAAMRLRAENARHGDAARQAAALEAVLAQIGRIDHLAAELLTMTQRRNVTLECVDMDSFLREVAADFGVGVRVAAGADAARCDAALLRRALASLLDNAVRHAGTAGSVTLAARRVGEKLQFQVDDNGGGVDPALRDSVFEPFVSGRADGTGLGLAIARELAAAHSGSLHLADPGGDAPGHGAVFVLEVPWRAC